MRGPIVDCANCHQRRHLAAHGLCEACYQATRRSARPPRPTVDEQLAQLDRDYTDHWRTSGYGHAAALIGCSQ